MHTTNLIFASGNKDAMPLDQSDRRFIMITEGDFEKLVNAIEKQISVSGSNNIEGHTRCQIKNLQRSVAVLATLILYGERSSIAEIEKLLPSYVSPTILQDFTTNEETDTITLTEMYENAEEPSDIDKVKSVALELIDFELHTEFGDRLKEKGL